MLAGKCKAKVRFFAFTETLELSVGIDRREGQCNSFSELKEMRPRSCVICLPVYIATSVTSQAWFTCTNNRFVVTAQVDSSLSSTLRQRDLNQHSRWWSELVRSWPPSKCLCIWLGKNDQIALLANIWLCHTTISWKQSDVVIALLRLFLREQLPITTSHHFAGAQRSII